MRTADQLRRLSGKFCAYLNPLLKSEIRSRRNKAIHQLFAHLQIYPDSLDQFLPLIRHLLNKENGFDQGLVAQMAVEYLKGSSSSTALQVLREHEERIAAEAKERSELFPRARQGDADAQGRLGVMYATGKGVEQNDRAAVYWYRKAALQDDADAQFRLGVMYEYGHAVAETTAVNWYRKAAEQGHAEAQYKLGEMYAAGVGVGLNNVEAVYWYHQAAEQGHVQAQFRAGEMYDDDLGETHDEIEAAHWYESAAEQGHVEAQFRVGEMYESGKGVDEDDKGGCPSGIRKAAEQGHVRAQYTLGIRYEDGRRC